jgi:hypothetical protein
MISAEKAIRTLHRDLTISSLMKAVLLGGIVLILTVGPLMNIGVPYAGILLGLAVAWSVLSFYSARGSNMAADSPSLIAAGQFAEAEQEIEKVIRSFWLFRSVKLMGLHHLAVLRHAQRQWRESAMLSRALLKQRLHSMPAVARTTQLMLADSLMELGDLTGAYETLLGLYAQKVSLVEAMNLLVVQLDYETRIGAWASMFHDINRKVQLAELMPASSSARAQAMLALAARRLGRTDWADWLRRRVELLTDINELSVHRPMLKELWADPDGSQQDA